MNNEGELIRKNLPYIIFALVGLILLLSAKVIQNDAFWSSLLLNLGIVVIAVTVVELLWKFVGGNPLLEAIKLLQISTSLLKDIDGSGIVRIYSERKEWESNLKDFLPYVASAREVDLMGNILRNNWTSNQKFMDILQSKTQQKECKFRFLLLDPEEIDEKSNILKQRSKDEARWNKDDEKEKAYKVSYDHMKTDIKYSLYQFETVKSELNEKNNQYLEIKVVNQSNIYCNIIRADDKMIVAKYLLSVRGSDALTIEIYGRDTSFYKIFSNEFESMWKRGVDWRPSTKVKDVNGR